MSKKYRLTLWLTEQDRQFVAQLGEAEMLTPTQVLTSVIRLLRQSSVTKVERLSRLLDSLDDRR